MWSLGGLCMGYQKGKSSFSINAEGSNKKTGVVDPKRWVAQSVSGMGSGSKVVSICWYKGITSSGPVV